MNLNQSYLCKHLPHLSSIQGCILHKFLFQLYRTSIFDNYFQWCKLHNSLSSIENITFASSAAACQIRSSSLIATELIVALGDLVPVFVSEHAQIVVCQASLACVCFCSASIFYTTSTVVHYRIAVYASRGSICRSSSICLCPVALRFSSY